MASHNDKIDKPIELNIGVTISDGAANFYNIRTIRGIMLFPILAIAFLLTVANDSVVSQIFVFLEPAIVIPGFLTSKLIFLGTLEDSLPHRYVLMLICMFVHSSILCVLLIAFVGKAHKRGIQPAKTSLIKGDILMTIMGGFIAAYFFYGPDAPGYSARYATLYKISRSRYLVLLGCFMYLFFVEAILSFSIVLSRFVSRFRNAAS